MRDSDSPVRDSQFPVSLPHRKLEAFANVFDPSADTEGFRSFRTTLDMSVIGYSHSGRKRKILAGKIFIELFLNADYGMS